MEAKSKLDLKREHCNSRMKETEDPSLFVVMMERRRIKLAKKGCKVDDPNFLDDILSALPENENARVMNPHQMKKQMIKKAVSEGNVKLAELSRELTDVCKEGQL